MTLFVALEPWLAGPRSGELLFPLVALPVLGLLLAPLLGARGARLLALLSLTLGVTLALASAAALVAADAPLVYALGGWAAPLGVELRLDGPAALMVVLTAALLLLIGLHAAADFSVRAVGRRATLAFWTLLLGVWAGLNGLFLGRDLFNLYVAIEVLTFSAVPLVCLKGHAEQFRAAFRYLLFALLGSALYLLGAGLMLGVHGTLDIAQIRVGLEAVAASSQGAGDPVRWTSLVAVALMSTGLLAKTALMPLHLWLPPAHGGAPAPASAVLSALVVKGSFFLLFRLWLDLVPNLPALSVGLLLGGLGVFAILLGNLLALMQARLKLLVAYSTLAQLGYLFLLFPLAGGASGGIAATAALIQVVSHALAKAALFSLMDIARPGMGSAAAVADVMRSALTPTGFWSSAGPVLAVALLVVLVLGGGRSSVGRAATVVGRGLAGFDALLRQWRVAGALLLSILLTLGWAALG